LLPGLRRAIALLALTFLLAHLSDPHVVPLPQLHVRDLAGKRLTGYVNWCRGRHAIHDMAMLETLAADLLASQPDHIALTGDLVNIGLRSEFVIARRFIERLGTPDMVSTMMPMCAHHCQTCWAISGRG
jgi:3',5'-cyclic AMP phosphodiesterase CpdA